MFERPIGEMTRTRADKDDTGTWRGWILSIPVFISHTRIPQDWMFANARSCGRGRINKMKKVLVFPIWQSPPNDFFLIGILQDKIHAVILKDFHFRKTYGFPQDFLNSVGLSTG